MSKLAIQTRRAKRKLEEDMEVEVDDPDYDAGFSKHK